MPYSPRTYIDGEQVAAVDMNRIEQGIVAAVAPVTIIPVGRYGLFFPPPNSTGVIPATAGNENGVGIVLPAMSIDQLGISINTVSAGSNMRIGIRPVSLDGSVGAPVIDCSISGATAGNIYTSFT